MFCKEVERGGGGWGGLRANPLFTVEGTKPGSSNYLHNLRVRAGSGALRFTDEVWLRVCAAEALVPRPQAAVTVGRGETHAVALFACEVPGRGQREDDELAPLCSAAATATAPLQTGHIVEIYKRGKRS